VANVVFLCDGVRMGVFRHPLGLDADTPDVSRWWMLAKETAAVSADRHQGGGSEGMLVSPRKVRAARAPGILVYRLGIEAVDRLW